MVFPSRRFHERMYVSEFDNPTRLKTACNDWSDIITFSLISTEMSRVGSLAEPLADSFPESASAALLELERSKREIRINATC